MTNREVTIGGVCLAVGALIGSAVTYFITKKAADKYVDKVESELRQLYKDEIQKLKEERNNLPNILEKDQEVFEKEFKEVESEMESEFASNQKNTYEVVHENIFEQAQPKPEPKIRTKFDHVHNLNVITDEDDEAAYNEEERVLMGPNGDPLDDQDYDNIPDEELMEPTVENDIEDDDEKEIDERSGDVLEDEYKLPYSISEEEYGFDDDQDPDYQKATLYYYSEDEVLSDAEDETTILTDRNKMIEVIGEDTINRLEVAKTNESIFIKDERCLTKYEIIKIRGSYEDLGFKEKTATPKSNKRSKN